MNENKLHKYLKTMSGTNTLISGDVGSGKTSSLPTFIAAGVKHNLPLKLAVIITDPEGEESLIDGMQLHAPKGMDVLPMDRLFYKYIPPASSNWGALTAMAKRVNTMGYKDLSEMKSGLAKDKHRQFLDVLSQLANFEDQHGNKHGPVDNFDSTWMLAIDGLSGINNMAKQMTVGLKPTLHQGEWGVAMSTEEALINQVVAVNKCFTCLTTHLVREKDEIVGSMQLMPAFLGQKLAPIVPRIFSDVVLQVRDVDKFRWSTVRRDYIGLKARNLKLADNLPPDFNQIVTSWLNRQKLKMQNSNIK